AALSFGGFLFALEHGEEPRRTTTTIHRDSRLVHLPVVCLAAVICCPVKLRSRCGVPRSCAGTQVPALFVHFFSGVLIQQHIRRKTTTCRTLDATTANPVSVRHMYRPRGSAARTILTRAYPACVDV